ncbi:dispanin subfamily A member 2b isoform X2 [Xyrauchen texanus]|uniref:dispanin subfamily A member 2b isoform X2 n=1 Tax=Xyrauchen texanus TaxID=154827 RepID=UPI0022419DD4|nr:dispanin subfamily A member 2b isoform X2 [Xyrauchen texanus]
MEDFQVDIPEMEFPEMEFEMEEGVDEEVGDENIEDIEVEECESQKPKKRRAPHKSEGLRKVQVKVKDYLCCSVLTLTFCNIMFLGSAALMCSLQALKRKFKRDVKGARKFSCCACFANIAAVILTIIMVIVIVIVLAEGSIACNYFRLIC